MTKNGKIILVISIIIIIAAIVGCVAFCSHSARFHRWVTDVQSNLGGGLERTINVYTANGDLIASYEGKIDIDDNVGGYVKFDYDGNRYIYYNCFVESIAEIG